MVGDRMNLGLGVGLGFGGAPALRAFKPTDVAGCVLWLRADLGITIATGVSVWADQSGTGDANKNVTQATGVTQPTRNIVDAAYNGQSTLSFSGTQEMQSGAWAVPLGEETHFVVGNFSGVGGVNQYFTDGGGANERVVFNNSGASAGAIYAGAVLDSGVANKSTPIMLAARFNGASSKIWISRLTANASGSSGIVGTRTGLAVGGNGGSAPSLVGKIAEIIIYSGALTDPGFASVAAYLGARYALTIGA